MGHVAWNKVIWLLSPERRKNVNRSPSAVILLNTELSGCLRKIKNGKNNQNGTCGRIRTPVTCVRYHWATQAFSQRGSLDVYKPVFARYNYVSACRDINKQCMPGRIHLAVCRKNTARHFDVTVLKLNSSPCDLLVLILHPQNSDILADDCISHFWDSSYNYIPFHWTYLFAPVAETIPKRG